ncbi:hypothetical protein, partial [Alishewanella sp. HH-ZS]|uniref:hypothetical protein n=1 Tax=Alishewanella sp. HH-ZS TaxID=1856684 RepID=UPI001146DFD8
MLKILIIISLAVVAAEKRCLACVAERFFMEGTIVNSLSGVEIAFESYQKLISEYKNNSDSLFLSNEAKTRLKIIDEVLLILGWSKDEFNPETHVKNLGYTDYLIKVNKIPRLVIEAKKIGDTFKNYHSRNSKNCPPCQDSCP